MAVSGSKPEPGQFTPPLALAILIAPRNLPPLDGNSAGGTYGVCSQRNLLKLSSACCRSCGVKSITSSRLTYVRENAGGLVGNGCVGAVHSAGVSVFGTGRYSIGQIGWPVIRSKTYSQPCLLGCASSLRARPSIVASISNEADELSWSHRPWWTCWKCHLRTPVFRSTATMLSANRLLP